MKNNRLINKKTHLQFLSLFYCLFLTYLLVNQYGGNGMNRAVAESHWISTILNDYMGFGSNFTDCEIVNMNNTTQLRLKITGDWVDRLPVYLPPSRFRVSIAAIGSGNDFLLFGGSEQGDYLCDTWVYNLSVNQWTEKYPINHPSARSGIALASILGENKVLLFGGHYYNTSQNQYMIYNDTWIYDGDESHWNNVTPPVSPPARQFTSIAPIYQTNKIVLFGGGNNSNCLNDTWVYDYGNNCWTQMVPIGTPPSRYNHPVASIWNDDKILLFGGKFTDFSGGTLYDTWEYDLSENQWSNKTLQLHPVVRSPEMSALSISNNIILYGLSETPGGGSETWFFNTSDGQWYPRFREYDKPYPREDAGLASLPGTGCAILTGGHSGPSSFMDTWLYDPSLYNESGEYLSPYYDTLGSSRFDQISWKIQTPPGTTVKFQLRTSDSNTTLKSKPFVGPNGTNLAYYSINGSLIWSGHYANRWIQYKAFLSTKIQNITPVIEEVHIKYDCLPEVPILLEPENERWINISTPLFKWDMIDTDSLQGAFEWEMKSQPNSSIFEVESGAINTSETFYIPMMPLKDGLWYWRVRAQDAEGEWSPFSEYRQIGIDTTPPRPFAPWAVPGGWTNTSPEIMFSSSDETSGILNYTVWIDNNYIGEQDSPYTFPNNITDGIHIVKINAYDRAGNIASGQTNVLIDRTPPEPFVPSLSDTNSQMLSFTTLDKTSTIDHYEIKIDSSPFKSCSSPLDLSDVNDGLHEIIIRAFDKARNQRDESMMILLDRAPPVDLSISISPAGWSNVDPTITFSASDVTTDISHYQIGIDLSKFINATSPYIPQNMTDGIHTLRIRAFDRLYNVAEKEAQILIDKTPPDSFSLIAEPSNWTRSDPLITFKTTDSISGIEKYMLRIDNAQFSSASSPYKISSIMDGSHNITVRAFDVSGNYIDSIVRVYIDRTPPQNVSMKINGGKNVTSSRFVNLRISAQDDYSGLDQICFSNDGYVYAPWQQFEPSINWTLDKATGEKTVYAKVKDFSGNEAVVISATIKYEAQSPNPPNFWILASVIFFISILFIIARLIIPKRGAASK